MCDVYGANLAKAAALAPKAAQVKDFRAVLDDKDIDAVIIGTPDHWHALMTVMACQAGKDVYVEKPTSVAIAEGRKMVEAARKYNRVVQVGTQQRSAKHFQQAAKLVQDGGIGKVAAVRCWNVGNQSPDGIGNPPDGEPPADLDWDLWLGPAPKRPFNANRFGVVPTNFSYFRWFWDYAGGMMTDWGVHLIDIVQMAMKVDAPTSVSAVGGKFCLTDNRETPDTILASYQYPGFVMTYENRTTNGRDAQRSRLRHRVLRHRRHAVRRSQRLRADAGDPARRRPGRGPHAGAAPGLDARQPEPRAQLHRLREVAPEADLRHRDRPSLDDHRDPRQPRLPIRRVADVGRRHREGHQRQPEGRRAGRRRVSRAVEAGGLGVRAWSSVFLSALWMRGEDSVQRSGPRVPGTARGGHMSFLGWSAVH